MAGDKDTLLSMGFDPARVDWALKATGNRGLQPAMDHLLEHDGQPVPDLSGVSESKPTTSAMDVDEDDEDAQATKALGAGAEGVEAKSIKCSECGKIFKNTALANFHAEKSGHDQFEESTEEIKPLTEEEKKQKLAELREKMAAKRALKEQEAAKDNIANENLRRKAGKDMGKIKEDLKLKEAEKEKAQKKREKIEDAKARAAVKAQIEADKKARAEKAAREKALREGREIADAAATAASTSSAPATAGKDYPETRLQIRLSGGGVPLVTTLKSDAPLREVAEYIASQDITYEADAVVLTQTFPRKQFTSADFEKTLRELGLTPSAALLASPGA
ncbi:ubiquitin-related domain-containing protein [Flagelloscypha sp. PMI_526]|nr:ubiquitin-related domain-containing protein [Flagelloscypha sp. PMI_526]